MARIVELEVADRADVWESLGFTVSGGCCRIGEVEHRFSDSDSDAGRGVLSWMVTGLNPTASIDGLPTRVVDVGDPGPPPAHPNAVETIDHLVLSTPDIGRTVDALEESGLELRRTRDIPGRDGARAMQAFFRLGEVILEVVGAVAPPPEKAQGPARFYGLAFTVADIDATAAFFGDRLHPPKPAVQPGRKIATLDRTAGTSIPMAFMTADVR